MPFSQSRTAGHTQQHHGRGLRWTSLAAGLLLCTSALAQGQPIAIDLPPQSLDKALQSLARQSGVQIVFVTDLTNGQRSAALKGSMTVAEALRQLVAGSGLVVKAQDAKTFTIERASAPASEAKGDPTTLASVTVTALAERLPKAYAGGQVARGGRLGLLGNVDAMDTPFSVTRYTSELVENQQARTLLDVMDNDASVRASAPRDAENNSMMIRGFEFNGRETLIDGMYGLADTRGSMIEAVERIEVHKGPSAMLNGVSPWGSSPGGSINYVLKRAGDEPLTRFTANYASDSQFGGHLDLGRRFGDNKELGIRLNTSYRDGKTDVDLTSNRSSLGALSLDYRGERLRAFIDLSNQDRVLRGGWSSARIGSNVAIPQAPKSSINSKQPWEFFDGQNRYAVARVEYDVTDNWTLGAAYGQNKSDELYLLNIDSITNVNGNKTGTPSWIPGRSKNETRELSLKGSFDTGPVKHKLSVVTTTNEGWRGQPSASVPGCGYNCAPSNIYDPIYRPAPDTHTLNTNITRMTSQLDYTGVAVADIMKLWDDRVVLMLGARQQDIASTSYSYSTGAVTGSYRRKKISPSAGVVFKLQPDLALYASYIESLNPGGTVGSFYSNAGEIFTPFVTQQYEAGLKHDFGSFSATASVFQVSVPSSVEVASPTGGKPRLVQDGEERHRGLEFNIFGEPTQGVRVLSGLMLLDAKMTRTQGGQDDGKHARGAPRSNLNLGVEWDVAGLPGLTLTGRAVYTSRENLDLSGRHDRTIPDWTRYDVGARYAFKASTTPVTLRLNIDNVFNKSYWAAASRGVLTLSSPRSIRLSATMDF